MTHHNPNSKGSSLARLPAKFLPNNRWRLLHDINGIPIGRRLTLYRSIRVDASGVPRSKTWNYRGRR